MVDDFASRVAAAADEMRRKAVEKEFHTETREALPAEVQELLLEMADKINGLNLKQIETEKRLAIAESLLHDIGSLCLKDGAFNEQFARSA